MLVDTTLRRIHFYDLTLVKKSYSAKKLNENSIENGLWITEFAMYRLRNKQQEIMKKFVNAKLDIAILSETKRKGNGTEKVKHYVHFYSGMGEDQRAKTVNICAPEVRKIY